MQTKDQKRQGALERRRRDVEMYKESIEKRENLEPREEKTEEELKALKKSLGKQITHFKQKLTKAQADVAVLTERLSNVLTTEELS